MNKLKIRSIIRDLNLRPRGGTDIEAVERYKEMYRSGTTKPVVVQKKGLKLIDGFHRIEAKEELYRENPELFDEYIDIDYEDISDDELLARATMLNLAHGVPLSKPEQNRVIGKLLASGKTHEEIGKIFGLSHQAITLRINNDPSLVLQAACKTKPLLLQDWLTGKNQADSAKLFDISPGRASQIISEFKNNILEQWQTGNAPSEIQQSQEFEITNDQIRTTLKDKKLQNKDVSLVDIDKIIQGDAFTELKQFPDNCIDLVIIDPPYNISSPEKVTKKKGEIVELNLAKWDKQTESSFIEFTKHILLEIKRVLRDTGSFYIFIDKVYISTLWKQAKEIGLLPKNIIVWQKTNPVPDTRKRNWVSAKEVI